MFVISIAVSGTFLGLSLLHLYWGRGGRWPGHDEQSLLERVVGAAPSGRMPGFGLCAAVALILMVGALVPLALMGWVPLPFARYAAYLGGGVLLLRGVVGYVDHRLRPATVGTPFVRLNRRLYSPLCLALSAALFVLARG